MHLTYNIYPDIGSRFPSITMYVVKLVSHKKVSLSLKPFLLLQALHSELKDCKYLGLDLFQQNKRGKMNYL